MAKWRVPVIALVVGAAAGWVFLRSHDETPAAKPLPPPPETAEQELERLAGTIRRDFGPADGPYNPDPESAGGPLDADELAVRRKFVLDERRRADADIAAGTPAIEVDHTHVNPESEDVEEDSGLPYRPVSCLTEYSALRCAAYDAAIRRALREHRIVAGSYRDRFTTPQTAISWLEARAVKLEPGGAGVALPGNAGDVCVPRDPRGSSQLGTEKRDLHSISRAGVERNGPLLRERAALFALSDDGRVYVVVEPAHPFKWRRCYVFDTVSGLHLQTFSY